MEGPEQRLELIAAIAQDALLVDDTDSVVRRAASTLSETLALPLAAAARLLEDGVRTRPVLADLSAADARFVRALAGVLDAALERERLEARARRAGQMEAAGRLAAAAAHDFNNLFGVIANFAQLAAAELPPGGQAAGDLEQIRLAAASGGELTQRLSALAADRRDRPPALSLAAALRAAEPALARALGRQVRVEIFIPADLRRVRIAPDALQRVLMHLVRNARDAMPAGGRLKITAVDADLAGRPAVRLSIMDSGSGMTAEVAARATDPYFTTKPIGRGDGLGLAAVHGIVTATGGTLDIESRPSGGTAIHLHLPS